MQIIALFWEKKIFVTACLRVEGPENGFDFFEQLEIRLIFVAQIKISFCFPRFAIVPCIIMTNIIKYHKNVFGPVKSLIPIMK